MVSVAIINPYTLIIFAVVALLMWIYLHQAVIVMQETNRLESELRTPTHDAFIQIVQGIIPLRAYGQRKMFIKKFVRNLDEGGNASFTYEVASRWLALRLDFITVLFTVSVTAFCVGMRNSIDNSNLAYIVNIVTDVLPFISFSLT